MAGTWRSDRDPGRLSASRGDVCLGLPRTPPALRMRPPLQERITAKTAERRGSAELIVFIWLLALPVLGAFALSFSNFSVPSYDHRPTWPALTTRHTEHLYHTTRWTSLTTRAPRPPTSTRSSQTNTLSTPMTTAGSTRQVPTHFVPSLDPQALTGGSCWWRSSTSLTTLGSTTPFTAAP